MESSKTEVLSFDDALSNHKKVLTESLVNFDEGQRIRKIMLDIDSNSSDYEYYFQSGQQSKQAEVSKLQAEIDELQGRVKELELINFDSELHFDAAKEHIDHLQKRIDRAVEHIEEWYGVVELSMVVDILNGDQS